MKKNNVLVSLLASLLVFVAGHADCSAAVLRQDGLLQASQKQVELSGLQGHQLFASGFSRLYTADASIDDTQSAWTSYHQYLTGWQAMPEVCRTRFCLARRIPLLVPLQIVSATYLAAKHTAMIEVRLPNGSRALSVSKVDRVDPSENPDRLLSLIAGSLLTRIPENLSARELEAIRRRAPFPGMRKEAIYNMLGYPKSVESLKHGTRLVYSDSLSVFLDQDETFVRMIVPGTASIRPDTVPESKFESNALAGAFEPGQVSDMSSPASGPPQLFLQRYHCQWTMRPTMILRNRTQCVAIVFTIIAGLNVAVGQNDATVSRQTFSFDMKDSSLLQGLLKFGSENQLPIGIVLQPGDSLCRTTRSLSIKDAPAGQIIEKLLEGSDYVAEKKRGVWTIMPRKMPTGSSYLLNIRMEQFGTMRTTVQGLGIILAGYIRARLRPNEGYAGDIVSSTSAENVEPFTLHNVTVEEAANHIATLASKGLWILYPVPDHPSETSARHLYVYGYQDDAGVISALSCKNPDPAADEKR